MNPFGKLSKNTFEGGGVKTYPKPTQAKWDGNFTIFVEKVDSARDWIHVVYKDENGQTVEKKKIRLKEWEAIGTGDAGDEEDSDTNRLDNSSNPDTTQNTPLSDTEKKFEDEAKIALLKEEFEHAYALRDFDGIVTIQKNITEKILALQTQAGEEQFVEQLTKLRQEIETKKLELDNAITPELSHPAITRYEDDLKKIEVTLKAAHTKDEQKKLEQRATMLKQHLEKLRIALDPTKNELERIDLLLARGVDYVATAKKDFDAESCLLFLKMARKGGKRIELKKIIETDVMEPVPDENYPPSTWVEVDRGNKNGVGITITDAGNILITFDHHEGSGTIEATSAAEGEYLFLKDYHYFDEVETKEPGTLKTMELFVDRVNKQDNLVFSMTLDELRTKYPNTPEGIMHMLPTEQVFEIMRGRKDFETEFTDEEKKKMVVSKKRRAGKPVEQSVGELVTIHTRFIEERIEDFEKKETDYLSHWELETREFGKTLIFEADQEMKLINHIARAKKIDTLAIINPATGDVFISSKKPAMQFVFDKLLLSYPQTVFKHQAMIVKRDGRPIATKSLFDLLEVQPLQTAPYKAGDADNAHDTGGYDLPLGKKTIYTGEKFAAGDSSWKKESRGDGQEIPTENGKGFDSEPPYERIDPKITFEIPKVKKTAEERRRERIQRWGK